MDTSRFEELLVSCRGALPNMAGQTVTKDQAEKLKVVIEQRAVDGIEFLDALDIETESK